MVVIVIVPVIVVMFVLVVVVVPASPIVSRSNHIISSYFVAHDFLER